MDKPRRRFSPFIKQCLVTGAVCSTAVAGGCGAGYPAVLLPQLQLPGALVPLSKEEQSWITAAALVPVLLGNLVMPSIMDRCGRKAAHLVATGPLIVAWFFNVLATSFLALLTSRLIMGFSMGLSLPLRSVLIGEYTSPKNRGVFLMTLSVSLSVGIFVVHVLGSLMSWQKTAMTCAFFPYVGFVVTMYLPESPSYLASRGRYEECRKVFRWLRGDEEEEELEKLIQARKVQDSQAKVTNFNEFLLMLKKKEFYVPIVIMFHANSLTHFSGGVLFTVYPSIIINMVIGSAADVTFWLMIFDAQRILLSIAAMYIIRKFKRRTMLFSIGGLCVVSQLSISAYVYARVHGLLLYDAQWIPILLMNINFFTLATGMQSLPPVIGGEVFPLKYRSIGGSISMMLSLSFSGFIVLKIFPGMVESIGIHGTYTTFAGVLVYILCILWALLPETKGKTLQEIEDEIKGETSKPGELAEQHGLKTEV